MPPRSTRKALPKERLLFVLPVGVLWWAPRHCPFLSLSLFLFRVPVVLVRTLYSGYLDNTGLLINTKNASITVFKMLFYLSFSALPRKHEVAQHRNSNSAQLRQTRAASSLTRHPRSRDRTQFRLTGKSRISPLRL